ncbi:MAG: hypothetical protein LT081_15170 [Hydrogenophaga sp.]|nr:hypothetical protein [Hydrogenophaga sp.]
MTSSDRKDATISLVLAGALGVICLAAAHATGHLPLFSLSPPGGGAADVPEQLRVDLHMTFFTIWASMLLATPALMTVAGIGASPTAWRWWRITWTASLLVFLVHFYWAAVIVFGNDWSRILNTPRVSAPRLDTVFAVWWVIDVTLAWLRDPRTTWVRLQRWGVHLLAFVLFFMGAAREGELALSRALGWAMAVAVVAGLLAWLLQRRSST